MAAHSRHGAWDHLGLGACRDPHFRGGAGALQQSQKENAGEHEIRGDKPVIHIGYMLPEFIMRGPIRKMGSMDPVNTIAMMNTAQASVRKLMICVKSAMYWAVSSS
jgi:hypothetical protein